MAGKKTIFIAIPCLLKGGSEFQTLNLVRALVRSDYRVYTICYFEHTEEIAALFTEAGSEVIFLSDGRSMRPSGIRLIYFLCNNFRKLIRKYHPEIVHVQYFAPGTLPILLFRLLGVKKVIATLHTPAQVFGSRIWVPRLIGKYVTALFLSVSNSTGDELFGEKNKIYDGESPPRKRKYLTLYNCIDHSEIPTATGKAPYPLISCVARLRAEKGTDVLIRSIPRVIRNIPQARFIILGDGDDRRMLEELSGQLGCREVLTFAGSGTKREVFELYLKSHVAVVPSRFEGFGLSALEAMACGIPVVASDTGGLREVVRNGEDGLLFENGDPESLASALITLLKDKTGSENMGKIASERSKELFSFPVFEKKISAIYSELLKDS